MVNDVEMAEVMTLRLALSAALMAASFAAPFLARAVKARRGWERVLVAFDAERCSPEFVARSWATVAQSLDERPRRLRAVVEPCGEVGRNVSMDWERDGRIAIRVDGTSVKRMDLRGRWIPDHPVPLPLTHPGHFRRRRHRKLRLFFAPVDANRFRVSLRPDFRAPAWLFAVCSAVAATGVVFVVPECLAAAAGLALGLVCARVR